MSEICLLEDVDALGFKKSVLEMSESEGGIYVYSDKSRISLYVP